MPHKTKNYSEVIATEQALPDLQKGATSITLTLSSGLGQAPVGSARIIGVKPSSTATAVRVGFETLEADGTATGTAAETDFKKGVPVDSGSWTWFNVGTESGRTLYVKGGTSDTVQILRLP